MKHMQELESLKAEIADLDRQAVAIGEQITQAKLAHADAAGKLAAVGVAKQKRRSILASLFLGRGNESEKAQADAELADAESAAAGIADQSEAADAAVELLQDDLDAVHRAASQLRQRIPELKHAIALERFEDAFKAYIVAAETVGLAFAKARAAAIAADEIKGDNAAYLSSALAPTTLELPAAAVNRFDGWVPQLNVKPEVQKALVAIRAELDTL